MKGLYFIKTKSCLDIQNFLNIENSPYIDILPNPDDVS